MSEEVMKVEGLTKVSNHILIAVNHLSLDFAFVGAFAIVVATVGILLSRAIS